MRWHILSTRFKFDCAIPGSSACFSTCVASMSAAGASPFSCGHLDPAHTCTPRHVGAKRSLSVPLKRRRAFSSPHRPCRCSSLTSRAGAASVAASVVVEAQPEQQDLVYSPRVSVDNRLRQLEASFRAQSAAELESSQEQLSASDGGSDLEGTSYSSNAAGKLRQRHQLRADRAMLTPLCPSDHGSTNNVQAQGQRGGLAGCMQQQHVEISHKVMVSQL